MLRFTAIFLVLLGLNPFAMSLPAPLVPDRTTPGSVCNEEDNDFLEYRYEEEIPYCERNVSSGLKNSIYQHYGIPSECRKEYTIDHFYPLSLGGDNSRKNLWPEHKSIKAVRADLELDLYKKISQGKINQARALAQIKEAKLNPDTDQIEDGDYCDLSASIRIRHLSAQELN